MQPIHTAIAIAVALGVVILFFLFDVRSLFQNSMSLTPGTKTELDITTGQEPESIMPNMPTGMNELQVIDIMVGTGATAESGDTVTVHYVGTLTDGQVFDASRPRGDAGFTFNLGAGQVIKGWDQGVAGMKEGGRRVLIIPASLAYGDQAVGPIPPGSTLIFEVELIKVEKTVLE